MAKNKLFKDLDVSNSVSRSGFDLSQNVKFTAKAGELLPVFHRTMMPGDKFRINLSHFTRTRPLNSSAFTTIREYFDFFFVPYRLLWKNANQVLSKNQNNSVVALSATSNLPVSETLPYLNMVIMYRMPTDPLFSVDGPGYIQKLFDYENEFGFNRGVNAIKLLNYLGYCYFPNNQISVYRDGTITGSPFAQRLSRVSILPLLAYNKIYYDYFRNTQWEDNQPYNYNVDYMGASTMWHVDTDGNADFWANPTMFDLKYSNYPKDLFFGLLPDSQFGDPATIDVQENEDNPTSLPVLGSGGEDVEAVSGTLYKLDGNQYNGALKVLTSQLSSEFNILQLRKASALQKYREIIGSGSLDYTAIIRKIFNDEVPQELSQQCMYLGGISSTIKINDVDNANLTGDNLPTTKGKAIGSQEREYIEFDCQGDFGVIMCLYHCQPVIDYALNAFHFDLLKTEVDDFANPVFDKLGFQELPYYFLDNSYGLDVRDPFVGYTSRYFDYKTSIDQTLGDFRGSISNWIAPVNLKYLADYNTGQGAFKINSTFFRVNPHILDPIFNGDVTDDLTSDQFWVSANFEISAVRPLDYLGVPF